MRLSNGAFEETFPEGDHRRFPSRSPNATDTAALPVRAERRAPEMLPVIRPDNGSSEREVPDLPRSLLSSLPREAHLGPISDKKSITRNRVTRRVVRANIR